MLSAKKWLKSNWTVDFSFVEKMDIKPKICSSTHSSEKYPNR
jgi:hypothetical protein